MPRRVRPRWCVDDSADIDEDRVALTVLIEHEVRCARVHVEHRPDTRGAVSRGPHLGVLEVRLRRDRAVACSERGRHRHQRLARAWPGRGRAKESVTRALPKLARHSRAGEILSRAVQHARRARDQLSFVNHYASARRTLVCRSTGQSLRRASEPRENCGALSPRLRNRDGSRQARFERRV